MELKRSLVTMAVIAAATIALCFKAIDETTWKEVTLGCFGGYLTLKTVTDYLPGNGGKPAATNVTITPKP
jgi:hypothetical protein